MKTETYNQLHKFIEEKKQVSISDIVLKFNISKEMIHRHLKKLIENHKIRKVGIAPKVYYIISSREIEDIGLKTKSEIIENNWLEILPNGKFIYGNEGFLSWCKDRGFDSKTKEKEYETIFSDKEKWKKSGLIEATEKITQTFGNRYIDKIWYIDFYSWEIFGKTMLGKLILYAKQNSDIELMKKISTIIKNPLSLLLEKEKFDLIGLIPHSIKRKRNFLNTTLKFLDIYPLPQNIFDKVFEGHSVAQKTLKTKLEREKNANDTLFLNIRNFPKKILLIDDACGSGATLNIASRKIKELSPKTKVYAITFVGSLKGFDVIAEI